MISVVLCCCKLAATECNYMDTTSLWKFHSSCFRRIIVILVGTVVLSQQMKPYTPLAFDRTL
jgi:hypothetical protein